MQDIKLITIIIVFFLFIIIKINILQSDIYKIKKASKLYEKFTLDELDNNALQNFLSLAKGGSVTLSSLNITNALNVNGNTNINGHLSVKNGSDFSGGNHIFRDAESKNNQYIRIGNPWGIPGLYVPDNADFVIGNNGIQNIYMHGGETRINNNAFIIKDNRLQYTPGNYEMNFGNDGWIRLLNINTGDNNAYNGAGFACRNLYSADSNIMSPGEIKNNGSKILHNSSVIRIRHLQRNAFFDNGDGWSTRNWQTNPYMLYELQAT